MANKSVRNVHANSMNFIHAFPVDAMLVARVFAVDADQIIRHTRFADET